MTEASDYDYHLPPELIAQEPVPRRVDARLLVVDRATGTIAHQHVRDLPEILRPGDCLVLNDTKVIPARLEGHRSSTGGRWEGLFLAAASHGVWRVMARTRGKPAAGETITIASPLGADELTLRLIAHEPEGTWVVSPEMPGDWLEILQRFGRVPLPPYIRKGEMLPADREHYQTVFARVPGAVAAPTAGLHFTEALLQTLERQGVRRAYVTLHVGQGTFRPIATPEIEQHAMHSEWAEIGEEAVERIEAARAAGGRVVAVGTTCVRTLESAVGDDGHLRPFRGETRLYIHPPYRFRAVDVLMTNFHLPRTTLLVLVRTFGGDALIQRAYAEAIQEQYRFFSYGDAMLVV